MKFFILTSLSFLFISTTVLASDKHKITFPLSKGEKSISFDFSGEIYKSGNFIEITEKSNNEIASFIAKVISSNASGEKQKILSLWSDRHKDTIDSAMSNPKALKLNTALFNNMKASKLLGYIEYGDYIICYVHHDLNGKDEPYLKEYPLETKGGALRLTNDLSGDIFFSQISRTLAKYIWSQ